MSNKDKIEEVIRQKFSGLTAKFIPVEAMEFEELYSFILQGEKSFAGEKSETNTEPSAEEMLVTIGWITENQLQECELEAKTKELPLDEIFRTKEYLSYERIVSYLKKKYGKEIVSKSNIVIDKTIMKLLPDDIIAKKKVIPMSMEGNKLAVAMVNPDDKYTIRELSLSTGRSLNVYCIPYFEYEIYLL